MIYLGEMGRWIEGAVRGLVPFQLTIASEARQSRHYKFLLEIWVDGAYEFTDYE